MELSPNHYVAPQSTVEQRLQERLDAVTPVNLRLAKDLASRPEFTCNIIQFSKEGDPDACVIEGDFSGTPFSALFDSQKIFLTLKREKQDEACLHLTLLNQETVDMMKAYLKPISQHHSA